MSDNELEIVFENVASGCEKDQEQNNSDADVICLSPVSTVCEIPKKSTKKPRINQKQRQIDHPKSKFKSVKNVSKNLMKNKRLNVSSIKDSANVQTVPPRIITEGKADSTISKATTVKTSPLSSEHALDNCDILIDAFMKSISDQCAKSSGLHLTTQFHKSPLHKNSELRLSSLKTPAKDGQVNYSKEKLHTGKTQGPQKNEIIENSISSSNPSGGSNSPKTSSPELLQWVQRKESLIPSTSSTSKLSEPLEVNNLKHDIGTTQYPQRNKIVDSGSCSTDLSEGSKHSKTSSLELLQPAQKNKSIEHRDSPSTSELVEQGKVHNFKQDDSGIPQCSQKNKVIINSRSFSTDRSGGSEDSKTSPLEFPQGAQKNKRHKPSSTSELNESGEGNFQQHDSGTTQHPQRNKIVDSSCSTDLSGGSKDSNTSSPGLPQWVQKNKSIEQRASPSTSELGEPGNNKEQDDSGIPWCTQKNKVIVNSSSVCTYQSGGSKDPETSSPELLQWWAQKNKSIEIIALTSTSESSKPDKVHNFRQDDCKPPQYSQENKIIVNSSSFSTDFSGESKDSKTSSPEFLQWVQKNKSIEHRASSTSDLPIKVHSGASPSSTQSPIKLSYQLSKHPNKFSINGSPASSPKNRNFYSSINKTPKSGHKASLSFTNKTFPGNHLSPARGVKRKLNFSNNSSEVSSSVDIISVNKNSLGDEMEPVTSSLPLYSQMFDAYLLRQLKLHIDVVLEDSTSRGLISDQEMDIIQLFSELNTESQDFYARMHNRKYKWNRLSDIRYDTSTEENMRILEERNFLETDMKNVPLADMIDLLKITELKELSKSLGIKCTQNKKSLSKEIINYCRSQKTLGFQLQIEKRVTSSEEVVKQRIEDILGPCFILSPEPRGLFRRIHLLFNLKFNRNEQTRGGSQDLFEIQFVGTEKALYPKCSIDKTVKIFTSRDDLLKFQIADDLQVDFFTAVGNKDLNKAEALLNTIRTNFVSEFDFISEFDDSPRTSPSNLPLSLRKFTPGTVYAYVLTEGVEVLKKLKKKEKAIDDLLLLLDQTTFLPYMRGRWYEKLMTLHRTAGQHKEVAKTICAGMRDPHVDDQCSYVMSCRTRELLKKKFKGADREIKLMLIDVPLYPELEYVDRIEIRASALDGKSGYKRVYIQDDETGDGKKYSSVEELVKSHYCPRKYKKGIHAENSLVSSLFGIMFWDIIYEHHVPCAFISPYQTRPLDLSSGEFYKNRQAAIDTKLSKISEWTDDDVSSWVTDVYNKNCGKSSLVHWKWFENSADIVSIINCIGLQVVLKVCERYAKKYRAVRSGFPDLFLWSPGEKNKYKFVEVKGPNDVLSTNQKLWLDFLVKINASVEICSVVAHGSKTVNASSTSEQPNPTVGNAEVAEDEL